MQEGTTDRRGRSHPPQCTISFENRQIVRMTVMDRSVTSRTLAQHIESVTSSVSAHTIRHRLQQSGQSARRPLLGLDAEPQTSPPPMPARSPDLSPIENMWSMVAQRLTQITLPAATPDQLWLRVEAAWFAVPQEHIQSLFESMLRRVVAVISNNGGYSGY
ncbi:HTH_Tnp_Tc3_2 domain-containing protein [Trichonephila clavipes]|nr:HTH_Tnp_Tc3_2 domain-containing protein [Trichonephila clavipes]